MRWHLEAWDARPQRLQNALGVEGGALLHGHAGLDALAEDGMRGAHDLDVAHATDTRDLGRGNVHSASDDHVLEATGEMQVAVLVHIAQVAGVKPAVGIDGLLLGRQAFVAVHETHAAREHLPHLAGRAR